MTPVYLTIAEAAAVLKVSPRTIKRYQIPYYRMGGSRRYDPADIHAYMATRRVGGEGVPEPASVAAEPSSPKPVPATWPAPTPGAPVRHRNKMFVMGGR